MDPGYPKSMITIAVLASAIIVGILLAKVVDAFHDRQSIRDDASDIRFINDLVGWHVGESYFHIIIILHISQFL